MSSSLDEGGVRTLRFSSFFIVGVSIYLSAKRTASIMDARSNGCSRYLGSIAGATLASAEVRVMAPLD
jgi:hypothetical protein